MSRGGHTLRPGITLCEESIIDPRNKSALIVYQGQAFKINKQSTEKFRTLLLIYKFQCHRRLDLTLRAAVVNLDS